MPEVNSHDILGPRERGTRVSKEGENRPPSPDVALPGFDATSTAQRLAAMAVMGTQRSINPADIPAAIEIGEDETPTAWVCVRQQVRFCPMLSPGMSTFRANYGDICRNQLLVIEALKYIPECFRPIAKRKCVDYETPWHKIMESHRLALNPLPAHALKVKKARND